MARLEALYLAAVERRIAEKRKAQVLGVASAYAERAEPDLTGPRSAARHLAQVETHLSLLLALEARGKLPADESKTVPALSREIRALRAELALGAFDEKGELRDDDAEL